MAVYIDNFNAPYGRMKMCHMLADTTEELLQMVDKICVKRKWIQHPNSNMEHFDICLSHKAKAISFGAIEVGFRQLAKMRSERKSCNDKLNYKPEENILNNSLL